MVYSRPHLSIFAKSFLHIVNSLYIIIITLLITILLKFSKTFFSVSHLLPKTPSSCTVHCRSSSFRPSFRPAKDPRRSPTPYELVLTQKRRRIASESCEALGPAARLLRVFIADLTSHRSTVSSPAPPYLMTTLAALIHVCRSTPTSSRQLSHELTQKPISASVIFIVVRGYHWRATNSSNT